MTEGIQERPFYWERFMQDVNQPTDGDLAQPQKVPPGEDLAALRRGVGRAPGSVPAMWPLYCRLNADGKITDALIAEHEALCLFGVHQQSEAFLVHRPGYSLGTALCHLRGDGRHSAEAVERRFAAAATADDIAEVTTHLRGLVNLLKTLTPTQGFDYTQLFNDLRNWQSPDRRGRVRRRWGAAFFAYQAASTTSTTTTGSEAK